MEHTPLGRLARMYKAFTKNYKDLDKEAASGGDGNDGAPIYHSDQDLQYKDEDCKCIGVVKQ